MSGRARRPPQSETTSVSKQGDEDERVLQPDDFVCFAIYSAGHAFSRVYKPLLKALGLTYPQYIVMVALWAEDDQTVGALCDRLFLESSTITPLLKRLQAMGYVVRNRDPADERLVRIGLTETGRAMQAKARDYPACVDGATGLAPPALQKLKTQILEVRRSLIDNAESQD
ncbi:MAG: winged helix-turn-helix transcriptional regulator [Rhizobiaceae bacterium]|nr:winged helix-turn-helix transcriptional regulator [Rhizobiaceae bacterium]